MTLLGLAADCHLPSFISHHLLSHYQFFPISKLHSLCLEPAPVFLHLANAISHFIPKIK